MKCIAVKQLSKQYKLSLEPYSHDLDILTLHQLGWMSQCTVKNPEHGFVCKYEACPGTLSKHHYRVSRQKEMITPLTNQNLTYRHTCTEIHLDYQDEKLGITC